MLQNIPNILTLLRIMLIPVMVAIFYINSKVVHTIVMIMFIIAGITDFFDGFLARIWKTQSCFGKVLDSIADKLLIVSILIMMIDKGIAPILPTLVILCREILISGMREYIAKEKTNMHLHIKYLAKIKTASQMLAIIILLLGEETSYVAYSHLFGNFVIWIAALLTAITGYRYIKQGIGILLKQMKTT